MEILKTSLPGHRGKKRKRQEKEGKKIKMATSEAFLPKKTKKGVS